MLTGIDTSTLTFAQPFYLWLLVVPGILTVLWAWRVFRRRADVRRYRHEQVLPARERYSLLGELAFWLCPMVAASLCIAALARPQALVTALVRAGVDLVILQDGSASMYVNDVKPDRWRRSVRFLRTFADALAWKNGDRVALPLFAHIAAPQLRLSKDPNAFFFFLDHLGEHSPFLLANDPTWDTNIEEGVLGLQPLNVDEELFKKTKNPKAFVVSTARRERRRGRCAQGARAQCRCLCRGRALAGGLILEPVSCEGVPLAERIRAVLDRGRFRRSPAGGGEYFRREPDRDIEAFYRHQTPGPGPSRRRRLRGAYWVLLFAAALVRAWHSRPQNGRLWWRCRRRRHNCRRTAPG